MDRTDRSVFVVFGSVSVRFGPSSFLSRSGPTPSPKLSVLHIGPNRTETEPMLSIPVKDFVRTANLNRPAIIHESVRRENVTIWVAPITGEGWEDFKQLIPHGVSEAKDIPMTLVFVNGRLEANHICQ